MDDTAHIKATPRDFFMWLGIIVTFYWSVIAFLRLVFQYVDYAYPNALMPQNDPYQSGLSFSMASLIVLFPIFLFLIHTIRRDIVRNPQKHTMWVRRWALVLTLFLAGTTIVVDLIVLLNAYLSGSDILTPFLLKAAVVLLVSAGIGMHFLADLKGYWKEYPARAQIISYAASALVVITLIAGFVIVGTPQHAKLLRYDAQKVQDLQMIQSQISSYWQQTQKLPSGLSDVSSYGPVPIDPQSGASYRYQIIGQTTYTLCAVFNDQGYQSLYATPAAPGGVQDNWQHGKGDTCFTRSTSPAMPPVKVMRVPL